MQSHRKLLFGLVSAVILAIGCQVGWGAEILYLSRLGPEFLGQPGPDTPYINALETSGHSVDTSLMASFLRPARFDVSIQNAVNAADLILVSPHAPLIDASGFGGCGPRPGVGVAPWRSVASLWSDVDLPILALTSATMPQDVASLVEIQLAGHPRPELPFVPPTAHDLDGDGAYTAADVDLLLMAIATGSYESRLDLNEDAVVNQSDLEVLVNDVFGTYLGDANLDETYNTGDLVTVFQAGKYETSEVAGWMEGDWTGDLRFTSADLVASFSSGYCAGLRPAVAVPEPSVWIGALWTGLIGFCRRFAR